MISAWLPLLWGRHQSPPLPSSHSFFNFCYPQHGVQLLCALISFVSLLSLRGVLVFFIKSASVARFLPPLRSIVVAPVLNCKKSSSRSQLWSLEMTAQWLLPSSFPSSSEISLKTPRRISSYPLLCEQTGYSSTCFSFFCFIFCFPLVYPRVSSFLSEVKCSYLRPCQYQKGPHPAQNISIHDIHKVDVSRFLNPPEKYRHLRSWAVARLFSMTCKPHLDCIQTNTTRIKPTKYKIEIIET